MSTLKIRNNWEHIPLQSGIYLALNHRGYVGVAAFSNGKWQKMTANMVREAEEDERFSWIEIQEEK